MKPEASRRRQAALLVGTLARVSTAHAQDLADPAGSGVLVSAVNWLQGTLPRTMFEARVLEVY